MKIFTGQSLHTLLNTPTAHSLLAPIGQCGWTDGGCAILADALVTFLPGSMPVLVVSENGAEHVAVRWDGLIWDADGASMDRVMIKRWRTVEHIPSAVLEDGSVERMALRGAPRDPSVSGKLVLMLAHRFCKRGSLCLPKPRPYPQYLARTVTIAYWLELQQRSAEEFGHACRFDETIWLLPGVNGECSSCGPVTGDRLQTDTQRAVTRGQTLLFDGGEGVCSL